MKGMVGGGTYESSNGIARRTRVAGVVGRLGLGGAWLGLRAQPWWPRKTLTVVAYHRINRSDAGADDGLDPDLVDATPEDFEAQLRFFAKHFTCVTTDQVIAAFDGGTPLPTNPLLITFDDGYLDNYLYALPALQRTGTRAVFFVATSFMERKRLFWWDRIWMTVREATVPSLRLDYPAALTLPVVTPAERTAAVRKLNRIVKDTFALDLDRFLDGVARAAGVAWSAEREQRLAEATIMSWAQVEQIHLAGMQVQSHTRSHRVIGTLPEAQLASELAGARADIESRLGNHVQAIAYPVGHSVADLGPVRSALAAAGYRLGFTMSPGVNGLDSRDLYDLKRIAIDRAFSPAMVQGLTALPWLA